ncbi:energy transducer TonB [Puniceicoccaceae bacterium K14]|nr:energy transducer TonB [Puniceicoccaceae bacterium K14]
MLVRPHRFRIFYLVATFVLAIEAVAQTHVLVKSKSGMHPVIGMSGEHLIVAVDGERTVIIKKNVVLVEAEGYTDGEIRVLQKKAGAGASFEGDQSRFNFRFRVSVDAERDFEDCFIVFVVEAKDGSTSREIVDLGNIRAGKQMIDTGFEATENFGDSRYGYLIFSEGEEIFVDDPYRKKAVAQQKEEKVKKATEEKTVASKKPKKTIKPKVQPYIDATPARVVKQVTPIYPEELLGSNISGVTKIVYTMDEEGEVFEILDIKADHPSFLYAARDAVLKSRYKPSVYEGQSLVTTLEQTFAFNEFVCFAEGAEIVPYPKVKDREPFAVYGPNRHELAEKLERLGGKKMTLDIIINELGQVVSVGASGLSNDVVSEEFDDAFANWVFLPSLERGVAYSSRVSLRLASNR